jgi:hydrogenase maturation factor
MNLIYAKVVTISSEHGARMAKVRVRGALSAVPLSLVPEAQPGDTVLICDGVALGIVNEESKQSSIIGGSNVSRCSR